MIAYCPCPFMFAALLGSLCPLTLLSFHALIQMNLLAFRDQTQLVFARVALIQFSPARSQYWNINRSAVSSLSLSSQFDSLIPNSDPKFRSVVTGSSCSISLAPSVVENENWLRPIF